jgi:Tfp pilus assembly protein PilX
VKSLRLLALVALLGIVPATLLGCSDDTKDKVNSATDSAKQSAQDAADSAKQNAQDAIDKAKKEASSAVDTAGARGAAEYVRGRVGIGKTKDDQRSMSALEGYVDDLPSQVKVTGLEDKTGDGKDDDGKVQFAVGSKSACLTLPATGSDTTLADGAC